MSASGWIGVDLDETLARYDGWKDGEIGEPVPAMVARVKDWLAAGTEVRIFTARVSLSGDYSSESRRRADEGFAAEQRRLIEAWCEKHIGQRLPVTCEKDFRMVELWDDRCVQVVPNTGFPVRSQKAERQEIDYAGGTPNASEIATIAEFLEEQITTVTEGYPLIAAELAVGTVATVLIKKSLEAAYPGVIGYLAVETIRAIASDLATEFDKETVRRSTNDSRLPPDALPIMPLVVPILWLHSAHIREMVSLFPDGEEWLKKAME